MSEQEITLNDIVGLLRENTKAIATLSRTTAEAIDELARTTKEGFDSVGKQIGNLESDVGILKVDAGYLKSQMVTKEYLDDKIAYLRGDFIELLRKEDQRLTQLISFMKERALIALAEVKKLDILRPLVAID